MQAMTEEVAAPPTVKHAGRIPSSDGYGPDGASLTLVALVLGLVAVGAMLQAMMTNHGRRARGLLLNALSGAVAAAIIFGVLVAQGEKDFFTIGTVFAAFWLMLAILAFALGSLVQPPAKAQRGARI